VTALADPTRTDDLEGLATELVAVTDRLRDGLEELTEERDRAGRSCTSRRPPAPG